MDMALRPGLGSGFGQILRFLIEGTGCALIYAYMSNGELKYGDGYTFQDSRGVRDTLTAAVTLFLTDEFLRPEIVRGLGSESMKFMLQGLLVAGTIGFFDGLGKPWAKSA